ncbi:MAG: 16S rRNA (cytosine(967)-C(5))-methyltransferase RsmB [Planctomycetota bacterium]|nr:16S rRNA (cytosine(967)-C(5))-methyltransferase RsmB [Planctomycetota bacterium]
MNKANARSLAIEAIIRSKRKTIFVETVVHSLQNRHKLPDSERRLLEELAFGTVRRKLTLSHIVSHFLKRKKIEPFVEAALLVGAYQLLFLSKIPPYAAINETVEAVKEKKPHTASLVNAILRRIHESIEEKDSDKPFSSLDLQKTILAPSGPTILKTPLLPPLSDRIRHLSVQFSVTEFLVEKFLSQFGEKQAQELLTTSITPPPLTIRTNTLKTNRSELKKSLIESAIKVYPSRHPSALSIRFSGDIAQLEQFKKGWFYVQDESAMFVVDALLVEAGMAVLDCCAAPGGKTVAIAESLEKKGFIVATDGNYKRVLQMKENFSRLGVKASLLCADATSLSNTLNTRFDRILLDAPCSNSGVLRRRIEARYRITQENLSSLTKLQDSLLDGVAPLLKSNGILLYATCSILKEENEERVGAFLSRHPEFSLGKMMTGLPRRDGTDGFFFAQLKRK